MPKSKWGRHCCRPHSYRRVVFSSGEPSKKRLAIGFYPLQRVGGSFHRRSRRHPVSPADQSYFSVPSRLPIQSYLSVPKPFQAVLYLSTLPRPFPLRDCFPQAAGFCLSFHLPSFHNQVPGLSSECASRSSQTTALASGLTLMHVQSQRPRGQYPLRRLF